MREAFNPVGIIIHGSRAVGRERVHSDWDLCLLFTQEKELPQNGRLLWFDQNIEYTCHHVPTIDIEGQFGVKLQFGRVLFEVNQEATKLLGEAQTLYEQPLGWGTKKEDHALWMRGRIDGMQDTVDQPLIFERYASDFYARITNYWYLSLYDTNPKPIYIALSDIKEKDPEYFYLIETYVHGTNEEKVVSSEKIYQRCFGDSK